VHIAGIDLIRGENGAFYVLEDNLRCPSGVYMLENREITKRISEMFSENNVSMVANYPMILHNILISPRAISKPNVVLMTPAFIIRLTNTPSSQTNGNSASRRRIE
jgi:uncharacterized circularly permuted ATP-grasp superfamily protein